MIRRALALIACSACGGGVVDHPVACNDPARGPVDVRYRDVTGDTGIDFRYAAVGFQGGGLAVADFDGDGRLDLAAGRRIGGAAVWRNTGGMQFELVADALDPTLAITALAAADLDNDGDRDLIAAAGQLVILDNVGGRFHEIARFDAGTTEHILPVDLDGDGRLDLYIGNYDVRSKAASANRLFLNRGSTFVPAPVPADGLTWTTTAFDYDGDGDLDLYVANDTLLADPGVGSVGPAQWPVDNFLRNDGVDAGGMPVLVDIARDIGLERPKSSMSGVLADLDGDARLDLFVTDLGANKLYARTDAGYVDRGAELGVSSPLRTNRWCGAGSTEDSRCLLLSWGATVTDAELDGTSELLVVNGTTVDGDLPPVLGFRRSGVGYEEWSPGISCMDARALVAADLDGDGDEDLAIAHHDGPLAIFENLGHPAAGTWLRLALAGRASNRDGIGAHVTVRFASGRVHERVVGAGGVIHASTPSELVVGIGEDTIDEIEVRWPSGRRTSHVASSSALVLDEGD